MTCDERKDQLLLYAAGALDDAERDALAAHLASGCPQCAGALAEAEATLAQMPMDLPPAAPSPGARKRLMQRVVADAARGDRRRIARAKPGGSRMPAVAIAAGFGIVLGALAALSFYMPRAENRQIAMQQQLADKDATISQLQSTLGKAQLISLAKMPPQPKAHGRVYWDRDQNKWHVYVFDMMPPAKGMMYELWFITPNQKKVPAGTFNVDKEGDAHMIVDVPPEIGPISLAAVTDEPGMMPQPTGQIQLVGNVPTP
jgi:anti-sigma-K factor RskA